MVHSAKSKKQTRCVLGQLGLIKNVTTPPFPDRDESIEILRKFGMQGDLRKLVKAVMTRNDDGRPDEAWQLIHEALASTPTVSAQSAP